MRWNISLVCGLLAIAFSRATYADNVGEFVFFPDCKLWDVWASNEKEATFLGKAESDKEGRLCTVLLPQKQFDELFSFCALSSVQVKRDQGDDYICSVGYSPNGVRFEYRYRFSGTLAPVCSFVCVRRK